MFASTLTTKGQATIDLRLVIKKTGDLSTTDRLKVLQKLQDHMSILK